MATNTEQLRSSCQRIFSEDNVFSNTLASSQRTTKGVTHYIKGTGSLGRLKYQQKHRSLDASDEELEYTQLSQSTHLLGRVKSERLLAFNSESRNRRRRTIIVEKSNNSYGFTLQSYAIHYRRDPEFETITYVDYVEYDGPAYRAGMREGDVILSINGVDLEKADHKTLVAFIKSCDTRMRMVVLFEDCVRKVELHMRYIQLQTLLQNKLNELECIALRERELLDGKWKTHSLPVRKKANTSSSDNHISPLDGVDYAYYRPALSTEDVPNTMRYYATPTTIIPPPAQFRLIRHYRTPSSTQNSIFDMQNASDTQHNVYKRVDVNDEPAYNELIRKTIQSKQKAEEENDVAENVENNEQHTRGRIKTSSKHYHSHSCNPCIGHFRWKSTHKATTNGGLNANNDNISLDAYDLASPCCDTQCVPTRRRLQHKHMKQREHDCEGRSKERAPRPKSQPNIESQQQPVQQQHGGQRHHHHHHHHHHYHHSNEQQHKEQKQQDSKQQKQRRQHQQLHACSSTASAGSGVGNVRSQYIDLSTGLISYCTLHQSRGSIKRIIDGPTASNETFYWEPINAEQQKQQQTIFMGQQSNKSKSSYQLAQQTPPRPPSRQTLYDGIYQQRYHITATQIQPSQICINPQSIDTARAYVQKPRSWDNLTTKAIAMGYGYGYLDSAKALGTQPTFELQIQQQHNSMPRKNPHGRFSTYAATNVENYAPPPSQFVGEYRTTTTTTILSKSTEHLITPNNMAQIQQQQQQQPQTTINTNKSTVACGCSNASNSNNLKDQSQLTAFKSAQMQINQNKKFSHYSNCQLGYYSHLPRPTSDVATSTINVSTGATNVGDATGDITAVSEVTRL